MPVANIFLMDCFKLSGSTCNLTNFPDMHMIIDPLFVHRLRAKNGHNKNETNKKSHTIKKPQESGSAHCHFYAMSFRQTLNGKPLTTRDLYVQSEHKNYFVRCFVPKARTTKLGAYFQPQEENFVQYMYLGLLGQNSPRSAGDWLAFSGLPPSLTQNQYK